MPCVSAQRSKERRNLDWLPHCRRVPFIELVRHTVRLDLRATLRTLRGLLLRHDRAPEEVNGNLQHARNASRQRLVAWK